MSWAMLVFIAAVALLAPFFGADTRDGRDWKPEDPQGPAPPNTPNAETSPPRSPT
ncbi:hypothetical protein ACQP1K_05785 [Sphaerimonospora sp. CA-214678]|uniref:hypothetical protein n=1 Tax=Sphaerimonospora sp. CA-214678 TaxID=3240029 RepID=UPI003D92F4FD